MNKKGQTLGLAIIIAITVFLVGMISVNYITGAVTEARDSAHLNCSDNTISDGTKLTCLVVDWVVPYFIIIVFTTAGGIVVARLLL